MQGCAGPDANTKTVRANHVRLQVWLTPPPAHPGSSHMHVNWLSPLMQRERPPQPPLLLNSAHSSMSGGWGTAHSCTCASHAVAASYNLFGENEGTTTTTCPEVSQRTTTATATKEKSQRESYMSKLKITRFGLGFHLCKAHFSHFCLRVPTQGRIHR